MESCSCEFGGRTLTIETGKYAKQADGAAWVKYGDTVVLVTAVSAKEMKAGQDFFPLTVEFQEKFYAVGKIPGGFFKREAKPSAEATLCARMIDRPIRPLFPEGYMNETQVVATVLSSDYDNETPVLAGIGASAALCISDVPFDGPIASVRVGRVDGQLVCNPNMEQIKKSDIHLFVSGSKDAVVMVEGSAGIVPEEEVLAAIMFGWREMQPVIAMQEELRKKCGKTKREFIPPAIDTAMKQKIKDAALGGVKTALGIREKLARYGAIDELKDALKEKFTSEIPETDEEKRDEVSSLVSAAIEEVKYEQMRLAIVDQGKRIDGRGTTNIRPIWNEIGILPRAHGSAIFTRGETQVLGVTTLGSSDDEQMIDTIFDSENRTFMLHYNFPPFSVGEAKRMGTPGRREIGHGHLAERAISAILPPRDKFPYTIRIVNEVLESNGSSSMGSICSGSMSLMDAGVPIKAPVAGIAMGLIKENGKIAILSDILGDEDHLGDMDFKVAGTSDGVSAIQMDIKIKGVTEEILRTALNQAKEGRLHILGEMAKTISAPKSDLSKHAPRIYTLNIPTDKIGEVIGPGGKMIKEIVARTGCKIDINDDGIVNVFSADSGNADKAIEMINGICATAEVGKVYKGVVKKIVEFGAFVGILPSIDGLLHVSEIDWQRVNRVEDVLKEGDEVEVKVLEIDERSGKVRLSRKALLPPPEGVDPNARPERPSGGDRGRGGYGDRGGRGGDRGGRGGDRGGGYGRR